MGASAIPSQLSISKVHETFDDDGNLLDENYDRRFSRFLEEFEWYVSALAKQRESGTPY
jgi:NAD(P)H-dependent FMN reductase